MMNGVLLEAREKFSEAIDRLNDKIIKSTLEVKIVGDVSIFPIQGRDLEDWFIVSAIESLSEQESLAEFSVGRSNL